MIAILTALQVEYEAVRHHLADVREHHHRAGTVFDVGTLPGRPGHRVALAATGPGNLSAAPLTERAIEEFSPSAVMFVGVAGGLCDWLDLGDVVVASRVYSYHGGRADADEFLARPRAWEASHSLEQIARRLPRDNGWHALLPSTELPSTGQNGSPVVHFEPIAAGDVLLGSAVAPLRQQLRTTYNDAVAVEMESAGFAAAGHLNERVPRVTVRAISDHADSSKEATDKDGWQLVAARNAAAFAVALAPRGRTAAGRSSNRIHGGSRTTRLPSRRNRSRGPSATRTPRGTTPVWASRSESTSARCPRAGREGTGEHTPVAGPGLLARRYTQPEHGVRQRARRPADRHDRR